MRILKLTAQLEKRFLSRRAETDAEALRTASEIVSDVRKRGDDSLLAWTKKLDDPAMDRRRLWISQNEIRSAERNVSGDFLHAVRQAARNIRRVAEQQLPRPWSLEVEAGVRSVSASLRSSLLVATFPAATPRSSQHF
ncbi:MAG TPA: histidinol dehydrogenase [Candidatus Sulfotelmatobacter sp.]|nr:histidinol dehydrogenase [Candidatus Sulfotelmatobacter sp.]